VRIRGVTSTREKKPASVSLLWSSGFIVLLLRLLLLSLAFESSFTAKACTMGLKRESAAPVRYAIVWTIFPAG
jgi:hypothetical protein